MAAFADAEELHWRRSALWVGYLALKLRSFGTCLKNLGAGWRASLPTRLRLVQKLDYLADCRDAKILA